MKGHRHIFGISLLVLALALWHTGRGEAVPAQQPAASDRPAMHGMLIVGRETVFLSHLPMFQGEGEPPMPHRYQAILEARFRKAGSDPQRTYGDDRRSHPTTKVYTLRPNDFVLPALVARGSTPLRSFTANGIFRGHFENGGIPILRDVEVDVTRVVHFREFDRRAQKPSHLEYLLFGKGDELFLAHLIVGPPDFDQVLSVTVSGRRFSDEELAKGIPLAFPGTTNLPASRLTEGQHATGHLITSSTAATEHVRVEVNRELYFEEGELRLPPQFVPTREEQRAGFR